MCNSSLQMEHCDIFFRRSDFHVATECQSPFACIVATALLSCVHYLTISTSLEHVCKYILSVVLFKHNS